jgi:chromosome segregation ATPase
LKIDMGIQPTMGEVLESGYKLSMEHFLTMCSRYESLKGELERMYGVTRDQCTRGQAAAKDLKTTRARVAKLDGLKHELEGQLEKLDKGSPEAMEIRANVAELRQQLFELARQQKFFTFAVDSINNSIEKYQNFEETLNNLLYNIDDLLVVSSEKLTEIGEVVQTVKAAADATEQMDRMREAVLAMDNMVNIALKAVADAQSQANGKLETLISDLQTNHTNINDHLVATNKAAQESADKMISDAVQASVTDAKIEVRQVEIPTWAEAPKDASRGDVVKARQRMSEVVGRRAATFQGVVDVMNAQAAAKKAKEEGGE